MRALRWVLLSIAMILIAGCAHRTPTQGQFEPESAFWSGRLSLRADGQPPQSWSAGFELSAGAHSGQLSLFSPLGSTVAVLRWYPQGAELKNGAQTLQAPSLVALLAQLESEPGALQTLPLHALLDWLNGRPTPAQGWTVDLSARAQGRIRAQRRGEPGVTLQLLLDLSEADARP